MSSRQQPRHPAGSSAGGEFKAFKSASAAAGVVDGMLAEMEPESIESDPPLSYAEARTAWLAGLKVGDAVQYFTSYGRTAQMYNAEVTKIGREWLTLGSRGRVRRSTGRDETNVGYGWNIQITSPELEALRKEEVAGRNAAEADLKALGLETRSCRLSTADMRELAVAIGLAPQGQSAEQRRIIFVEGLKVGDGCMVEPSIGQPQAVRVVKRGPKLIHVEPSCLAPFRLDRGGIEPQYGSVLTSAELVEAAKDEHRRSRAALEAIVKAGVGFRPGGAVSLSVTQLEAAAKFLEDRAKR